MQFVNLLLLSKIIDSLKEISTDDLNQCEYNIVLNITTPQTTDNINKNVLYTFFCGLLSHKLVTPKI